MRTVGLFTWAARSAESAQRNATVIAMKAYAANRAWPGSLEIVIAEATARLLEEGGSPGTLLRTIGAGDKVILRSFDGARAPQSFSLARPHYWAKGATFMS